MKENNKPQKIGRIYLSQDDFLPGNHASIDIGLAINDMSEAINYLLSKEERKCHFPNCTESMDHGHFDKDSFQSPQDTNSWEEEFTEKFGSPYDREYAFDEMKSFISSLLQNQKKELAGRIKDLPKIASCSPDHVNIQTVLKILEGDK